VRAINALDDGSVHVRLAVVSDRWLARLLLRIGPGAEIVEPDDRRQLSAQAATTVLARYQ
jgi:proteasome accessory factor C